MQPCAPARLSSRPRTRVWGTGDLRATGSYLLRRIACQREPRPSSAIATHPFHAQAPPLCGASATHVADRGDVEADGRGTQRERNRALDASACSHAHSCWFVAAAARLHSHSHTLRHGDRIHDGRADRGSSELDCDHCSCIVLCCAGCSCRCRCRRRSRHPRCSSGVASDDRPACAVQIRADRGTRRRAARSLRGARSAAGATHGHRTTGHETRGLDQSKSAETSVSKQASSSATRNRGNRIDRGASFVVTRAHFPSACALCGVLAVMCFCKVCSPSITSVASCNSAYPKQSSSQTQTSHCSQRECADLDCISGSIRSPTLTPLCVFAMGLRVVAWTTVRIRLL